jgi:SAM-dependent methyltransferase
MTGFSYPQDMWNKRFSTPDYVFGEQPNAFLVSQSARLGHGHALALADGEGRNSVWLAQQGFTVDAFDFSAVAIEKAKNLAEKQKVNVNFNCNAWQDFDWKTSHYDLIAGIFFQFATPDERAELFEKIKKSLRSGGVLLIQGYGKNQLKFKTGGPDRLEHLYDEELLRQAFSDFDVLVCETYEATLQEGVCHSGMSALIGFVARKP